MKKFIEKQKRYVITWHVGVAKTHKRSKLCLSLAICEYSKGVCFIAVHNPAVIETRDAIKPLIIHDVYVDEWCEDADWCLNIDCPKNTAIVEALRESGITTQRQLENAHQNIEQIRKTMNLTNTKHKAIVYYEKPAFFRLSKPQSNEDKGR